MKKLLLLVAVFAFVSTASAQLSYGIKGGLNFANLTNADDIIVADNKTKASFYLGAYAEYQISDFFGVQPELVYSRQGFYAKEGGDKMWARINYLNLAAVAKIYVLDRLSIDLGPQIGFVMNSKVKVKTNAGTTTADMDFFGDSPTAVDLSFVMGASYKLSPWLDITARYNLGLSAAYENDWNNEKYKNSVFQIGVGYRF